MSISLIYSAKDGVRPVPPGSVNVETGRIVEGPGGKWVPCATALADGGFVPSIFEVGPGRRQVCLPERPLSSAREAMRSACAWAETAAG